MIASKQIIMLKKCISVVHKVAAFRLLHNFSIKNYMRSLGPSEVSHHHGIMRVDECISIDSNRLSQLQIKALNTEQQLYSDLANKFYQRSTDRRSVHNNSLPQQYDDYFYSTRSAFVSEHEYTVVMRAHKTTPTDYKTVLDISKLSFVKKYAHTAELIKMSFSPSHRYIAFGVDLRNNERIVYHIMDTQENRLLPINNPLKEVTSVQFISQYEVYYVKEQNHRPQTLYYLNLIENKEKIVFHQDNQSHHLDLRCSKDNKYLFLSSASKTSCILYGINGRNKQFDKIYDKKTKAFLQHISNYFILWQEFTNKPSQISIKRDNPNDGTDSSKVDMNEQKAMPQQNTYTILHKCSEDESLKEIDVFKHYIVLYLVRNAQPILRILKFVDGKIESINQPTLPLTIGTITPGTNHIFDSNKVLFYQQTPIVYNQGTEYNMLTNTFTIVQPFTLTGLKFLAHRYKTEIVYVPSQTNDYIPVTLVWNDSSKPKKCMLHVYGCYGLDNSPTYSHINLIALEEGWVLAYAHVRGGAECGAKWYAEYREDRRRPWLDLEEVVGYLIKERITHPALLFLVTHSAGAIAGFQAINRKPYLYKGIIMHYPFLDVLGTLLDPALPLTQADYPEFGNPNGSLEEYQTIEALSPYDNLANREYPMVHIVAGGNDYRCPLPQILKFVQRFRRLAISSNRYKKEIGDKNISVRIEAEGSHLGLANTSEESMKGCKILAMMEYVLNQCSNDCQK